jgi:small subunit ribosomal protein S6
MNKYELTIVLDGKATAAKKKSIQGLVEKIVELSKGKIGKVEDWGVKDLAYKLGKPASPAGRSTTGVYLHFPLELETEAVKNLASKIKVEAEILRYLLVRKD